MFPWVNLFSQVKEHYQQHYGLKDEYLAAISQINFANAKRNPNAQTKSWELSDDYFVNNDQTNPIVEGKLRRSDCGRITDGSATVFLASETYATQYAKRQGISLASLPYIKGWGHCTGPILLSDKLQQTNTKEYTFPHVHKAIQDAFQRAQIKEARELDTIELHDCFSITEYIALEHFGLTTPGNAWQIIENQDISFHGKIPVNPSGGLIGMGHPVGATGVRMVLDAYKQVSDQAGEYQVEGAKNVGILNIGGSFTTVASFVVGN